jgi:hypothetical protein
MNTPPQLAPIDWTRFEPGGAEFNDRYTTQARQILFVRIVRGLSEPIEPGTRTWDTVNTMALRFGLPAPRALPEPEYLAYLDQCLDTWETVLHPNG